MNKALSENKIKDAFSIYMKAVGQQNMESKRLYTDALIMWLGIYQTLQYASCRGSLEELESDRAFSLFGDCSRKWEKKRSSNSGALVQARQGMELETLQEAVHSLHEYIRKSGLWNGYRVIGVDGSTVALNQSNPALLKSYPGGMDHKGKSRWPIVHLVMLIDLLEATIVTANVGAKYGKFAQSEQELAVNILDFIKEPSIIVGDRNFGTYQIAKEFTQNGSEVLLRLSNPVAKSLAGNNKLVPGMDIEVTWKPSTQVRNKHNYDKQEQVVGRLIVQEFTHNDEVIRVNLFTTLKIGSAEEILTLYRKRWNLEEDIKRIKLQLKLKDIQAANKTSVDVEIFCKLLAFNLTRGAILMAVEGTDIDPRRISFSLAFLIVRTKLMEYSACESTEGKNKILELMLERLRRATIPERPGRSTPREVFGRRPGRYKTKSSRLKNVKKN